MVWQFYAYFIEINSPSVLGHQLDSLQWDVRWCVFFFGWWFSAFSGIRNQQKFMPWEDVLAFETNEFLVLDTICTTSAPRGFINIFCSSWSRCTCSRHEKNVICASQTFTPSQRWFKLWCLLCIHTKNIKNTSSWNMCKWFANASECLHLAPSKCAAWRYSPRAWGQPAQVWDEVQPQIADNIVDGRNPANQLIWRI